MQLMQNRRTDLKKPRQTVKMNVYSILPLLSFLGINLFVSRLPNVDMWVFLEIEAFLDGFLELSLLSQVVKRVDIIRRVHRGCNDNAKVNLDPVSLFASLNFKHI